MYYITGCTYIYMHEYARIHVFIYTSVCKCIFIILFYSKLQTINWPTAADSCWPLAAGRWPLAAGCWLLAAGCWLLAAGCWLLAAGCWLLAAGC